MAGEAGQAHPIRRAREVEDRPEAVEEFVDLAKGLFDLGNTQWDDPVWDVTVWCKNRSKAVRWQFLTSESVPFEPMFDNVAKASLVYQVRVNAKSPSTLVNWLVSIRVLYETTRRDDGNSNVDAARFSWDQLRLNDWLRAEDVLVRKVGHNSRYLYAGALQSFAELLESRGILKRTLYKHRQKRPRDTSTRHIEDREAAMEKLPPMSALRALADASQNPKNDWDRMLFAVVKLLVALGFRVGEVLTLPVDCWRVNENGQPYLTYWPEKGAPLSPKWIPSTAVELVRGAVETLLMLTQEARQRARVLEADPTRVPLFGGYEPTELLGTAELSEEWQMTRSGVVKYLKRLGISPATTRGGANGKGYSWRVDELERALVKAVPEHSYELITLSGEKQRLSEHLCLVPNMVRNGQPSLRTVRPLPASAVENFVSTVEGRQGRSVFERYGLLDEEGTPWSIRTHQFRHWINTVAHKGGLADFELARWMGRKDKRQNLSYQHLNQEERIERVKEAVRGGEMVGSASEVYHRLPVGEGEAFLEAAIEAAHVSPYGSCTHNFATKPCPYDVQCLTGCGSFLRTKGDQREIIAIEKIKRRAKRNLDAAETAIQEGLPEAANWIEHERRLLEGAERALAIEDVPAEAAGEPVVAVFDGAPSLGDKDPSRTRR